MSVVHKLPTDFSQITKKGIFYETWPLSPSSWGKVRNIKDDYK